MSDRPVIDLRATPTVVVPAGVAAAEVVIGGLPGPPGPVGPAGPKGDKGDVGPVGPEGEWVALTQAEYNALNPPDPDVLYIVRG